MTFKLKDLEYRNIYGYVSPCLVECYKRAVTMAEDGMVFVEIGALFGKSTCLMVELLKKKKVNVDFTVIDIWKLDDAKSINHLKANSVCGEKSPKQAFLDNANLYNFIDDINIIEGDSADSAQVFQDNSVDFLFLDARHTYEAVTRDALAWKDKVKGVFAGHDYKPHNRLAQAIHECLPDRKIEYIEPRSFWSTKT